MHETIASQMKIVEEPPGIVSVVDQEKELPKTKSPSELRECRNYGRRENVSCTQLLESSATSAKKPTTLLPNVVPDPPDLCEPLRRIAKKR